MGLSQEIVTSGRRYRFHTSLRGPRGQPMVISGDVREVGDDFVRVRKTTIYRGGTDYIIPFHAIQLIEESWGGDR